MRQSSRRMESLALLLELVAVRMLSWFKAIESIEASEHLLMRKQCPLLLFEWLTYSSSPQSSL